MNRKERRAASKTGAPVARAPGVQPLFTTALRHFQRGQTADAERLFRQVLAIDPRNSDSLHLLGVIAHSTGRDELAIELIKKAIAVNPREPTAHSNLGNLFQKLGRSDEAIASYRRALNINPNIPAALNNLGNALRSQRKLDEAIATYRKALTLNPDDPEVHYHLSMALLARGDLADAWPEYEWRWKTPMLVPARRDFPQPQWRGEAAAGRTLLIHGEQGFGDTLQFCRYAPLAAARGLRVVLEVPRPLARLIGGVAGVDQIVAEGEPRPNFDFHCPMLSLPLAFGTTLATIPADGPYLHADPEHVAAWRTRLAEQTDGLPRIGLVWAGTSRTHMLTTSEGERSIAPDRLAPLFGLPGLRFFSLQKDGPSAPDHFPLTDFMNEMGDFADTAALIANLDLVLSVDTAVAHLAAALGKPVWLLDRFDGCWRWLVDRRDSPWYPSVRLYRQAKPGAWDAVVAEVVDDLSRLAAT